MAKRNVKIEVYQRALKEAASLGCDPRNSHDLQHAVLERRKRLWERMNPRSESDANRWLEAAIRE